MLSQLIRNDNKPAKFTRFQFKSYEMALSLREALYLKIIEFDNINHDGKFSQEEITNFLVIILKQDKNQVSYVVKNVFRYDKNQDGIIEYDELVNFCMEQHLGQMALQRLHKQKWYSKGSQRLMNEREFIKTINYALSFIEFFPAEKQLIELFQSIDLNRDGEITYQDYFIFLKQYLGVNSLAATLVNRKNVQSSLGQKQNTQNNEVNLLKKYSKYKPNNQVEEVDGNGIRKSIIGNPLKKSSIQVTFDHNNSSQNSHNSNQINYNPNILNIDTKGNEIISSKNIGQSNVNGNLSNLSKGGINNNVLNITPNPAKTMANSKLSHKNQLNSSNLSNNSHHQNMNNHMLPNEHLNGKGGFENLNNYFDNQPYINNTSNIKHFSLNRDQTIIATKIARLIINQLRVAVIDLDSDKDLMLSFDQICLVFLNVLKVDNLQNCQFINSRPQQQKKKLFTYQQAIRLLINEKTARIFKELNLFNLNKQINRELFILILQRTCEIVGNTPLVYKYEQLHRLRAEKITYGPITSYEFLAYVNFIFIYYLQQNHKK